MAVQDPDQQPQQAQPNATAKRVIAAAAAGKAVKGAVAGPGVAVALPPRAAVGAVKVPAELFVHGVKIAVILRILRRLLRRQNADSAKALAAQARKDFPDASDDVIRQAIERELAYERAFQAKMLKRVEADLVQAGKLPTPEQQQARVNAVLDREKHYAGLRDKALAARVKADVNNANVKDQSPEGAVWELGNRKKHTLGCLALAGKALPWAVLDTISPPVHAQCGCWLRPLEPGESVLPHADAVQLARDALKLEEAIRAVADDGEIDAYLDGREVRPVIARALHQLQSGEPALAVKQRVKLEEAKWQEFLHPRGRGGKWIDKFGTAWTGVSEPGYPERLAKSDLPHEPAAPPAPYVPKPTYMPELSPGSTVVSGPPPIAETIIGGNAPEPAKQGPIPSFQHLALKLKLPPAFGADAIKARAGDRDYFVRDHGGDRDHVAAELLANALYRQLHVDVPTMGSVKTAPEPDFAKRADDLPNEPKIDASEGARISTGIILREPDGRITLIEPRNHYGGYIHTFPKGGVEQNLTPQQNAHKELWEETGLHAHITGVVGDFQGDTGTTRYYLGVRTGGEPTPSDETAAIKTVTPEEAAKMLNKQRDQDVLKAVLGQPVPTGKFADDFPPEEPGSALAFGAVEGKTRNITEPDAALSRGYMADALLANRNFLGDHGENVRWTKDGTPIRTNMSATFGYGRSGAPSEYGDVPEEIWTMRYRGQAAGTIVQDEAIQRQQAAAIARILSDAKIDRLVKAAPFGSDEERKYIADGLKARVGWMRRFARGDEDLPQPASGADARAQFADAQNDLEVYPEEAQALEDYATKAGRDLDGKLRSDTKDYTDEERKTVKRLDAVLEATDAPLDSYAYMGATAAPSPDIVGKTFGMKSYIRASTDMSGAKGNTRIRLLIPGGARAMHLDDAPRGQPDMLAPRDQRIQITGLSTGPDGTPTLEGLLLPYRRPTPLPYKAPKPPSGQMSFGYGTPKPGQTWFQKGDRVMLNGMKATITGMPGGGKANVKMDDGGKGYTVPFASLDPLKEVQEADVSADFKEWLHPRGRGGKWIRSGHTHALKSALADVGTQTAAPSATPSVSESVKRIEALGVQVTPPGPKSTLSDQEVSDIADVFEDAFKQYPILDHGPGPPVRKLFFASGGKGAKMGYGTLASTAISTDGKISHISVNDRVDFHRHPMGPPPPDAHVGGSLSVSSRSWGGVMWHELGHAMMNGIDMAGHHDSKRYVDWMARYGVTFDDCQNLSTYAVASRSEGIAEMCSMENTPGGYASLLPPDMQAKVHKMFDDLRNWDLSKPYSYQEPPGGLPTPTPKKTPKPKAPPKQPTYKMPDAGTLSDIEAQVKANPGTAGPKLPVTELDLTPGDVIEGGTPGLRYVVIADPKQPTGLRYVPLNQGKHDAYRFSATSKRRKVDLHFEGV